MNTNTHSAAPEEIMALMDGELTGVLKDFAGGHASECEECRQVQASLHETSQVLHGWRVEPLPARVEEKVLQLAHPDAQGGVVQRLRPRLHVWSKWALGAGLAAVVLLIFEQQTVRKNSPTASFAEPTNVSSAPAATSKPIRREQNIEQHRRQMELVERARLESSMENDKLLRTTSNAALGVASPQAQEAAPLPLPVPPMIAHTISLTIVVKDFGASRGMLDAILARHHGYSAELTVNTAETAARTLNASLRVPAAELLGTIGDLKSLGRVENETQSGEEVTQEHADLVARLKNSRETEQRLQAILLQRTGKISDVLEVEQEIDRVRGEIEQMEAEQKSLEHRVDFATVNLSLSDVYQAQLTTPFSVGTRLHNGFVSGYHRATETLLGIALFFMEAGPSLLIWLIILGLPGFLVWRRYRRSLQAV